MNYRTRCTAFSLATILCAGVARSEPTASDRATARALADEAGEALDQRNYEVAADRFGRAEALVHAPTLLLGLARAQVGLRKFVEAQENYQRIIREGVAPGAPAAFVKALGDAQREIKTIAPKLAWVTVTLKDPQASVVTIDGVELPKAAMDVKRAINPGNHVLKTTADGYKPATTTIDVAEGESRAVTLALEAVSSSSPATTGTQAAATGAGASLSAVSPDTTEESGPGSSKRRTLGWIGLGVGAAGLAVGGVAGLVAIGRHNTLESDCPNGKCSPSSQSTIDGFRTMATVSTVGFIVGAVAAAGGGVLLLTAQRPVQTGHVDAYVGLASVGARVTF